MSWLVYGATIPLEMNWPGGIVATSFGLATCGACLLLMGLAARAFGRSEKALVEVVAPLGNRDQPRREAA